MRLLKSLLLAILGLCASIGLAQNVPAPQIPLSGNVGAIGFPILNSGTFQMPADANVTFSISNVNTSAVSIKITSAVSLTATRTISYPAGRFQLNVENATTGSQALSICGPTGTCVTVPNDTTHYTPVMNDGTNYIAPNSGSSGVTTFNTRTGAVILGATDVQSALGNPQGTAFFGDSIVAYTGVPTPNLGFASLLRPIIGGSYLNMGVPSDQCLDTSKWIYGSANPQVNGLLYVNECGTNDVTYYNSSANLQTVFKRVILGNLLHLGIPQTSKAFAQSCTLSGFAGTDPNYSYLTGLAVYSTTSGDTVTCSVPVGPNGDVAVSYVIFNGASGTFTIKVNGTLQADPFASGTTFDAFGDGSSAITTHNGTTQGFAGAVFTGFNPNTTASVVFTVTSSGQPVEIGFAGGFPAASISNPYVAVVSPNHQNNGNDTLTGTYAGYVSAATAAVLGYGANAIYADTRDALLNTAVPIGLHVTAVGTSYAAPGWVSDAGVSYAVSGVPFAAVSSSPAQGQYAVTSGTYVFNVADSLADLLVNYTINCGANETAMFTTCYADTIHPNSQGHAVMASAIASVLPVALLTHAPTSGFTGPAQIYRTNSAPPINPSAFWTPNPYNLGDGSTAWGEGIELFRFQGESEFAGGDGPHGAYLAGSSLSGSGRVASLCVANSSGNQQPSSPSSLNCPIWVSGQGVSIMGSLTNNYASGGFASFGGSTYANGLVPTGGAHPFYLNGSQNILGTTCTATSSVNCPSQILTFQGESYISSGGGEGAMDSMTWTLAPNTGTDAPMYMMLGNPTPLSQVPWAIDISGATTANLLGSISTTQIVDTAVISAASLATDSSGQIIAGANMLPLATTTTLTTATSDTVTLTGVTSSSICSLTQVTNSTPPLATAPTYAVSTNTVTITHAATVALGAVESVVCFVPNNP